MSCAICEIRKEKRFCPAIHGGICPQCCGEQREVTLDCPSDCSYLLQSRQQGREHAADSERFGQIDRESMFPAVEITEQFLYARQELIMGFSFALAKAARADRSLMDRDLIAAVSGLAHSYQTLVKSNLIYEPATPNVSQQSVVQEVEAMVREFRAAEQQHTGQVRLSDSEVLKALVFLLRLGFTRTSGRPKSRAFIDFLFAQFPQKNGAVVGPAEAGSGLVIP